MEANNYSQVVPMTFEERVAMYMNCDKLDLARMLAQRDMHDLAYLPRINEPYPFEPGKNWWDYQITCSEPMNNANSTTNLDIK